MSFKNCRECGVPIPKDSYYDYCPPHRPAGREATPAEQVVYLIGFFGLLAIICLGVFDLVVMEGAISRWLSGQD